MEIINGSHRRQREILLADEFYKITKLIGNRQVKLGTRTAG